MKTQPLLFDLEPTSFKRSSQRIRSARQQRIFLLQNPYASLELEEEANNQTPLNQQVSGFYSTIPETSQIKEMAISKNDFVSRSRAIFYQYSPLDRGKRTLKPEYRKFIAENSDRQPLDRMRVLLELEKYDLSKMGNLQPHLNREREVELIAKLSIIAKRALNK